VAKPEEDVAVLLAHLGLRLPSRSKTVQNVVEKKPLKNSASCSKSTKVLFELRNSG
jgi:hypothetical protein